jgi:hypothetical protein
MATHKEEILDKIAKAWQELQEALAHVQVERMEEAGVVESWSVKDLIGHVTTWENEAMKVLGGYMSTHDLDVLRFSGVDEFNAHMAEEKRGTSLSALREDFERTHEELVRFIEDMSEEDLGVPEVERRIGADRFAHYAEHTGHIRQWLNT